MLTRLNVLAHGASQVCLVYFDYSHPECERDLTRCGFDCVDIQNSTEHCGGCYLTCEAGEACIGGECGAVTSSMGHHVDILICRFHKMVHVQL